MNIAIIDDLSQDRDVIREMTIQYLNDHHLQADIETFESAEQFFDHYAKGQFSIVLTDMMMPGMNGINAARMLREGGDDCQIVFITIDDSHALSGYDVEAAGYLLKPVDMDSLSRVLSRCFNRLKQMPKYIEVTIDRVPSKLSLNSILWMHTYRNAIQFHTDGGILKSYITFNALMKLLGDDDRFLLCYKGCLVNMDRIASIEEDDFRMENGDVVQMRKRGAQQIKQTYVQYVCSRTEPL